jgi:hypothetical protein
LPEKQIGAGRDDVVLDRVVDLVVGDDGRRHAGCLERPRPDRRALHTHFETLDLFERAEWFVDEDIPRTAAGIADQHDVGLLRDFVGDRLQQVGIQHLVPVCEIAEQEGCVDEGSCARERRHVRRRDDAVVDRAALRHVLEVLLLETERGVLVQHEIDRLAVVLLDQLLELDERLRERVIVIELHGTVQRQRRLRPHNCGHRDGAGRRA